MAKKLKLKLKGTEQIIATIDMLTGDKLPDRLRILYDSNAVELIEG